MPDTTIDPQDQIVDMLKSESTVDVADVIAEDRKDLVNAIKVAMAKLGMCVVVQTVDEKVTHPNKPGPVYDDVTVSVLVHEQVLINRSKTDLTSRQVAKAISAALHHERLGGNGRMLLSKGVFYQQDSVYLTYAVDFTIS